MDEDRKKMDELLTEIDRLQQLLRIDDLTGVLTRRALLDEALVLFRLAYRESQRQKPRDPLKDLGIVFLDIDDFKRINDTYGHSQGDIVLKGVGSILKKSVRDIDLVGRVGGEEFMIILADMDEEGAYRVAERIRSQLQTIITSEQAPVTASLGVASLRSSGSSSLEDLVRYADTAMYEAKHRRGKNTVVRYSELD